MRFRAALTELYSTIRQQPQILDSRELFALRASMCWAGKRAAAPFPAPLSPLAASFLRCAPDSFDLTKLNTCSKIKEPASLRFDGVHLRPRILFGFPPEWCSASPESPAKSREQGWPAFADFFHPTKACRPTLQHFLLTGTALSILREGAELFASSDSVRHPRKSCSRARLPSSEGTPDRSFRKPPVRKCWKY